MGLSPLLRNILIGIPIGITFLDTVGYIARVEGVSMQPALNPDERESDYVFLNRWAIRSYDIQHGDVVIFVSPKVPSQKLIKRVVGLSGDIVTTIGYKRPIVEIPDGHCWVEGDHTGHSMDSNCFGPVSLGLVTAKATCIVWPPSRWQYLKPNVPDNRRHIGTVFRHGLTIGDVDNDGDNELVVGTAEGDVYIFKGSEIWQKITGLGLISCVAVGDVFNYGCNALVVICGDGWAHIFYSPRSVNPGNNGRLAPINLPASSTDNELYGKMECVHLQRIPTNTKVVLVADVDQDGSNEMIIGLTDRVVRSYRWSTNNDLGTGKLVGLNKWECANQIGTVTLQHTKNGSPTLLVAQPGGTFMRIKCNPENDNEDEIAEQEGQYHEEVEEEQEQEQEEEDGAEEDDDADDDDDDEEEEEEEEEEEGYNYARKNHREASCVDYQTLGISRMRNPNISTEIIGDLQPSLSLSMKESEEGEETERAGEGERYHPSRDKSQLDDGTEKDQVDGNTISSGDTRRKIGNYEMNIDIKNQEAPSYENFSGKNRKEVSMEMDRSAAVLEGVEFESVIETTDVGEKSEDRGESSAQGKPYALATLDGTIMLVKDEMILWAMQVDHQIFALCRLDVTGDGADEIVACTWDGQTYILDQERRSVRFQFEEPVRAFTTGKYSVDSGTSTPSLVYNTFTNKIFLYYDTVLPSMVMSPMNPLEDVAHTSEGMTFEDRCSISDTSIGMDDTKMAELTEYLLYGGG